jgi:hypothetical protein
MMSLMSGAQAPIPTLQPGTQITIRPYGDQALTTTLTISHAIGTGASAIVYQGTGGSFQAPIAIKVPREMRTGLTLLQEARWTPRGNPSSYLANWLGLHPAQIPEYPYDVPVTICQLYRGTTESAAQGYTDARVPAHLAARWTVQAAAALRAADVLHRDIKPSNIACDDRMDAWLLDWGLSTPLPVERQRLGISIGRRSVGTPDYMSPEAIEGFEDVDHRSDIYSLGLTLYEWSVGKSARASETTDVHAFFAELVDANFAIDLSPVPAPLRRIVRLATAPARRERYQSWSVMIADCLPLVG